MNPLPHLQVPQWASFRERCQFPEPSFTYPSESPVMEPSLQVPLAEFPWRERLYFQSLPPSVSQNLR